jgi:pyruvate dehydrogenase E2 component (dihydrolipoamide acetyltransferase)
MRRIIGERMLESKQKIPCYHLEIDADVTDLVCLRNKLNAKGDGPKLSFNDFVLKACAIALRAFPVVNSRRVEGGIERRGEVNIGFAVGVDDGLIVPVVRDVDRKTIRQVSAESTNLTERARTRKLGPDEYQGGCMTVSNLGMYGIRSFIAIVNPGESTILGLGTVEDRVVFRQGGIQVRKVMALTLSVDHRLVDGMQGAQFLEVIRDGLEAPQRLVE